MGVAGTKRENDVVNLFYCPSERILINHSFFFGEIRFDVIVEDCAHFIYFCFSFFFVRSSFLKAKQLVCLSRQQSESQTKNSKKQKQKQQDFQWDIRVD